MGIYFLRIPYAAAGNNKKSPPEHLTQLGRAAFLATRTVSTHDPIMAKLTFTVKSLVHSTLLVVVSGEKGAATATAGTAMQHVTPLCWINTHRGVFHTISPKIPPGNPPEGRSPAWTGRQRRGGRRGQSLPSYMVAGGAAKARRKENVAGNLFVDESCIDCDTCRWMQGDVFANKGGKSAVIRQPETEDEKRGAYRALLACPTSSIRVEAADPTAKKAIDDFPFPVDSERIPGVFHLGFHDENSFGCSPWLVERADGNLMMDSPRFHPGLAKALDARGGVSIMVLSHIDDVGDHQRWKERFPEMKRVMHKADVQSYGDTGNIEIQLDSDSADGQIEGYDFWHLGDDLKAIHTPGHSRGSITLLYDNKDGRNDGRSAAQDELSIHDESIAFTGDHLALSGRTGSLTGFPRYGYDLTMQSESMKLLARPDLKFRWILPGHGRMMRFDDDEERVSKILVAAANTKAGRP